MLLLLCLLVSAPRCLAAGEPLGYFARLPSALLTLLSVPGMLNRILKRGDRARNAKKRLNLSPCWHWVNGPSVCIVQTAAPA
jgi:hypothetical protein